MGGNVSSVRALWNRRGYPRDRVMLVLEEEEENEEKEDEDDEDGEEKVVFTHTRNHGCRAVVREDANHRIRIKWFECAESHAHEANFR